MSAALTRRTTLSALASLVATPAFGLDSVFRRSKATPEAASRVVALEFPIAEVLALLDRPPVGLSDPGFYAGWIGVETDKLKDSADLGTRQQPSLEAIARTRPDLIVGVSYRHAPLFDALEQIAPTVLVDFAAGAGETHLDATLDILRVVGRLVGRADRAAEIRAEAEAAIARDAARIASAGRAGRRLVVLQELAGLDTYWTFTANSMSAGVARRLGLRFWPEKPTRDGVRPLTSDELMALDDVDVALVSMTGPEIPLQAKTSSAVWSRTPALKAGRVTLIERNIWNFGGPGSAMRLSQRLTEAVLRPTA